MNRLGWVWGLILEGLGMVWIDLILEAKGGGIRLVFDSTMTFWSQNACPNDVFISYRFLLGWGLENLVS